MFIMIVVCLPVILAFCVLTINVAWMQLTRTELRTATDAAVRAGGRTLSMSQDTAQARATAADAAARNTVAGEPLLLADSDLRFGFSTMHDNSPATFAELDDSSTQINAVRVTGRRVSGSPSGPVPLLFSGMFDRTTFEPLKVATATQTDRDVVLVLDRSGSMGSMTTDGTRWDALKDAVDVFLDTLAQTPQAEQVGLVTYSTDSTVDVELTMDYQRIRDAIDRNTPNGWTGIGRGINSGRDVVTDPTYTRSFARKTIVVMTDGIHNRGVDPVTAAANAQNVDNVTVHTITFSSGANREHMQQVADEGGGSHWHADDQGSLIEVFEDVANNLPTLLTE